ncbi:calcium-binding protein [Mycoplana rhizolycopersici]|uniref:Peptidase M10 serralysin C-terminal domain-containing protein n=1 Tax=Mycoplana rhizolycopersici TaxID=2746702 RepID=A0ABX2Q9T2_9HYPH|nr:calcium-binding protein [Rhizobium rhizolycopersici]NVP54473.1 hypothetical protein [Rhizobium rhizolycopersici]
MVNIYVNKGFPFGLHRFQMFGGLFSPYVDHALGKNSFRSHDYWGEYKTFDIKGTGFRYTESGNKFKSGTITDIVVFDPNGKVNSSLSVSPSEKLFSIKGLSLKSKELVKFIDNENVYQYGKYDKYYVIFEKNVFKGRDLFRGGNLADEVNLQDGDDVAYGYGGDDILSASSGRDILYGGDGNDQLDGGAGKDFAYGGKGDDTLLLGPGNDVGYGGSGADGLNGQHGNDRLYGDRGNDLLEGHNGNDTLYGGSGSDTLRGDRGNDKLVGGTGADSLVGGEGRDTFIFTSVKDSFYSKKLAHKFLLIDKNGDQLQGFDWIEDFSKGDKIDLRAIDANIHTPKNNKFTWIGESEFSGAAGELRFQGYHGPGILFEGDTNGDKIADIAVALRGYKPVVEDFFL